MPDLPAPNPNALTDPFYSELHAIARRLFTAERSGHTLQPTAVVNEACMRLMSCGLPDIPREQQLALAGRALKQVLIDHARARDADKRGGGRAVRLQLEADILGSAPDGPATLIDFDAIRRALERLRILSERQAEVISLRIFSGMTMDQIAAMLGISKRAAEGDWTVARAWLRRELASGEGGA